MGKTIIKFYFRNRTQRKLRHTSALYNANVLTVFSSHVFYCLLALVFNELGDGILWNTVNKYRCLINRSFLRCNLEARQILSSFLCFTCLIQVFLAEYVGPLLIYLLFYFRVPYIYRHKYAFTSSPYPVVALACMCHSFHYSKRLIETIFVHRFSHGTMPLRTIARNCVYYWGFAAWLAFYINHPLYTPPSYGDIQVNYALAMFLICEVGNFSIHLALNNLKSEESYFQSTVSKGEKGNVMFLLFICSGTRSRMIPYPTKNPFTWLFFFVSCPNYTYEVGAWLSFTIMTQCFPVALFTLVGFVQMTIWARGKHNTYNREYKDYPHFRMPIIPFLL